VSLSIAMDLENYSVKDFILNESFQKWILEEDEEANIFWEEFQNAHPNKAELICEAKSAILSLSKANDQQLAPERNQVWQMILKSIDQLDRDPAKKISEFNQSK
jgi:hypothetical protein